MQQILLWNENFAVGHSGLDTEHRHLVALINKIGFAVQARQPKELVDLLKAIQQLAADHIGLVIVNMVDEPGLEFIAELANRTGNDGMRPNEDIARDAGHSIR